ncbi:hypothetical protein F2Q69_00058755 [Brassica cretica]|uniref:Uncharacterized protein n=1 Tax=Brassica cretica TaxID=69181 RepID=A0A8S9RJA2_BRACR|nr:hypothetical protein F2Q69_00058755 [Brassica cretica]
MYMSKASHLVVPKHQRPPIGTEEAVGFHKIVKRIHYPVKIVVPCAVFQAKTHIPPDRSMQFSSYNEMVSRNPECGPGASHSHLQSFEHYLLLR